MSLRFVLVVLYWVELYDLRRLVAIAILFYPIVLVQVVCVSQKRHGGGGQ